MEILDDRSWAVRALDGLDADPDGGAARALGPLGGLYAAGARWLRHIRPDRPLMDPPYTFGVGNVRVGGTGKTPVTADLAERLSARGVTVAVLTRGYRASGGGDEPDWVRERTGVAVVQDAHRRRGVERARRGGADTVLLDDALQTPDRPGACLALLLERDLAHPPRPLPSGPAREDHAEGLARAQAFAVRLEGDAEVSGWVERARGSWEPLLGRRRPVLAFRLTPVALRDPEGNERPLVESSGLGRCLLLSGLARPDSFERDCQRIGLDVVASLRWDDHCMPTRAQRERAELAIARRGIAVLVCPEKNRERIAGLGLGQPLYSVVSRIDWDPSDPLEALASILPGRPL